LGAIYSERELSMQGARDVDAEWILHAVGRLAAVGLH